ncbi:MAG: methyltransferase domain-containing protein [Bdellovibrionales bacterium]|nr:methyltransferase domain-containing protein [Bdellovibrionales bacterium]
MKHLNRKQKLDVEEYLCECFPGLERPVCSELKRFDRSLEPLSTQPGEVRARMSRATARHIVSKARTIRSLWYVLDCKGARPTALLGNENADRIIRAVQKIRAGWSDEDSKQCSLSFHAAGSDSSTMQRVRSLLCDKLAISEDKDGGNLRIRVVRATADQSGWEVLVRLTPSQLGDRAWKVHNYRGAIHPTIAAALLRTVRISPSEPVLNLCSGSGTLLLELADQHANWWGCGVDNSEDANRYARDHLRKAKLLKQISILRADAQSLPFRDQSFSLVMADVPWGEALSSRKKMGKTGQGWLREMLRVLKLEGRMLLISQDRDLWTRLFREEGFPQEAIVEHRFFQGGFKPSAFLIERSR